ncbi:hypothetical protein F4802DRAFT_582789 [Xylaria palmicola]|nr:hypothetical protein F4802DRAFT_582789 [Xylaria palmicola]
MFSRLKEALNLPEEQIRSRILADQRAVHSSAGSPSPDAPKKPDQGDSTDPDPAFFEAAIKSDDDSDSSTAPAAPSASVDTSSSRTNSTTSKKDNATQERDGEAAKAADHDASSQDVEMPSYVKLKLKRLEKLENNYQEVLRCYKIAHLQIKNFERALQENTPVSSIKDTAGLLDYINQFIRQNDMTSQELRRISAEKDEYQDKFDVCNSQLTMIREKMAALEASAQDDPAVQPHEAEEAKTLQQHEDKQEDVISCDNEKSRLEAEEASKATQITQLEAQVATLKKALTADAVPPPTQLELDTRDAEIKTLREALARAMGNSPTPSTLPSTPTTGAGKKKNKKKNKKGGTTQAATGTPDVKAPEHTQPSTLESSNESVVAEVTKLKNEVATLEVEMTNKNLRIEKLSYDDKQHREEIEILRQEVIDLGQNLVEANDVITKIREESNSLTHRISEMKKDLTTDSDTAMKERDEYKIKNQTLESELGASQQLSQSRFKELRQRTELLSKAQQDLRKANEEVAALKITREELTSKQKELPALEKREKELQNQKTRLQRSLSDREDEIKLLNERLSTEKTSGAKLEDEKRALASNYRRLQAEKVEVAAKAEKISLELQTTQSKLSSLQLKIKELEDEVAKLRKEKNLLKEDVDLKTQQHHSAQGLLASMSAQNEELETRLREAQNQAESNQEELEELQKHLAERTREGETMRRRLKEENEKADARVRDMKSQMEAAIEDRDRIEDESSAVARRRSREVEELKSKIRELDREVKALRSEKDSLEAREKQWRQRQEELEQIEEKTTAETDDMRTTISSLRSALDASEQQVRDAEKQKGNLRKLLDDAQSRYEKTNKELRSVQAKLDHGNASDGGPSTGTIKSGADTAYIKTIFTQFLEAEDGVRQQMVPILLKVFGFNKEEEEKGSKMLRNLLRPGRR